MYIDKYNIKVIGQEYDSKKEKYINDITKVNINSTEGLNHKKFFPMLEEIVDAHEGCDVQFDITIKQHEYE